MPTDTCWSCETEGSEEAEYCVECGAPLTPFTVRGNTGFISDAARAYLTAISDGRVSRDGTTLDPELHDALERQLLTDIEAGLSDFALIMAADSNLPAEASGILEAEQTPDDGWTGFVDQVGSAGIGYIQLLIHGIEIEELMSQNDGS